MKPLVVRTAEAEVLGKLSDKERLILTRWLIRLMKEAQGMESLRTEKGRTQALKWLTKGIGGKLERLVNETKEESVMGWDQDGGEEW